MFRSNSTLHFGLLCVESSPFNPEVVTYLRTKTGTGSMNVRDFAARFPIAGKMQDHLNGSSRYKTLNDVIFARRLYTGTEARILEKINKEHGREGRSMILSLGEKGDGLYFLPK